MVDEGENQEKNQDKKERFVFQTADPISYGMLKQLAEENKLIMTEAEQKLWMMLRGKRTGYKFRRQHIIGDYIVDFVNLHYKVIIEVDGKYHFKGDQPISDAERTADLNQMGYTVVRFTNEEVLNNTFQVAYQIKDILRNMEISYPTQPKSKYPKEGILPTKQGNQGDALSPSPNGEGRGGASAPSPTGEGWDRAAWAVDAACSGNPGPMEYQAIDLATGARVFHFGPVRGTNNIGEFLAIVHALALMDKQGIKDKAIYSDSYNAILWVRNKKCKTKLIRDASTEQLFQIIARAEQWLRVHAVTTPVRKWETKLWGECPADFGRK